MTTPEELRGEMAFSTSDAVGLAELMQAIKVPLTALFEDLIIDAASFELVHRAGYSFGTVEYDSDDTGLRFFPMTKEQTL